MRQPNYQIRHATPGDLQDIVSLSKKSWPVWWLENRKFGKEHIRERIKEKRMLVATASGKVVGYALFGIIWSEMHFEDCFVLPRHRRQGIGSALLRKRVVIAKRAGYRKIISDCDVSNKTALKYHLKNGFEKCGYIRHLWDNDDSYVLSMDL